MATTQYGTTLRFGGLSFDDGKYSGSYREGYKGTMAACRAHAASLVKGFYYPGKGNLTGWSISSTGAFAHLDITYGREYDESGNEVNLDTSTGPLSSRLKTRLTRRPISQSVDADGLPNYRANWDHWLVGLGAYANLIPDWWYTKTIPNILPPSSYFYAWVKDLRETPRIPNGNTTGTWQVVTDGVTVCERQKPNDFFDWALYEITETGRHTSKVHAGWAVAELINSTVSAPILGDFGITALLGGNWKITDCDVAHNGRFWVSTRRYEKSGGAIPWDADFYHPAGG